MYKVGVALACRSPSEVLLIRDDSKRFLFDVSTIPHITIDFSDAPKAISCIRSAIEERLKEALLIDDARVKIAVQTLTSDELRILRLLSRLDARQSRDLTTEGLGMLSNPDQRGLDGLISKGCIRSVAENTKTEGIFYSLTSFGFALAEVAEMILKKVIPEEPESESSATGKDEDSA